VLNGFSSSSRPYSRVRPSLYQRSARRWLRADPQRGRAGRPREPERLDLQHLDAQLVLQGLVDGLAAAAADVQVGRAAAPVGDREDLVGGEHAEGHQRDGDPDDGGDDHVGGRVDTQVDQGDRQRGDQRGDDQLAELTQPALWHQAVEHADHGGGEHCDRAGRVRGAGPVAQDLHAERAGSHEQVGEQRAERDHPDDRTEEHEQVSEAAGEQQRGHGGPEQDPDRPQGAERVHPPHDIGQDMGPQLRDPVQQGQVEREDVIVGGAGGKREEPQQQHHASCGQPIGAGGQGTRQRRRLPGGPPTSTRPRDPRGPGPYRLTGREGRAPQLGFHQQAPGSKAGDRHPAARRPV